MARSQWHRFYNAKVVAQPAVLFELLSDMPNYGHWLPQSEAFGETTDVEPYPVQLDRGSKKICRGASRRRPEVVMLA